MFSFEKMQFRTHWEFCAYRRIFSIRKGPEYLYRLFDVSPEQKACEVKTVQVQVYIQQCFYDGQGAKVI